MILLWGLSEVPNSVSVTHIANTLSHLSHKIHEAGQFALQIGPTAEFSFSWLHFNWHSSRLPGKLCFKGKTYHILNPKRFTKTYA